MCVRNTDRLVQSHIPSLGGSRQEVVARSTGDYSKIVASSWPVECEECCAAALSERFRFINGATQTQHRTHCRSVRSLTWDLIRHVRSVRFDAAPARASETGRRSVGAYLTVLSAVTFAQKPPPSHLVVRCCWFTWTVNELTIWRDFPYDAREEVK